jgi:hypothetical protein
MLRATYGRVRDARAYVAACVGKLTSVRECDESTPHAATAKRNDGSYGGREEAA